MNTRRKFIFNSLIATAGIATGINLGKSRSKEIIAGSFSKNLEFEKPVIISTWQHGLAANQEAWKVISKRGRALDAVEKGVMVTEADPKITSVGYGGFPDRDGHVTLDACIMDEEGNAGSVACLENIMHPISVARLVMEKTPHVMLVGDGALQFALANGFKKQNLLTKESKAEWLKWLQENKYKPFKTNKDNHDTIGMIALDKNGNLSGACTTSGLAFKYHGRVGDSPIIGAGLYIDNDIGGAAATGLGEAVIKTVGSFLVVESMRNGKSPMEACKIACERIIKKVKNFDSQVGFIALNKNGEIGGYSVSGGFQYAVYKNDMNKLINSESLR
ncbi:MAG: N(4)-(beta-N-acetylglucosaminyl)-L-asparaginase [Ignavibacteriales bacterium]|nr:N(4)-(beta-N-acetylglucosaminyl)-L-asparaginase [Ignavibacteriales bacterium]